MNDNLFAPDLLPEVETETLGEEETTETPGEEGGMTGTTGDRDPLHMAKTSTGPPHPLLYCPLQACPPTSPPTWQVRTRRRPVSSCRCCSCQMNRSVCCPPASRLPSYSLRNRFIRVNS